ncbi:hypothetical protein UFOVP650_31 [uncultured Caudovirales phage]|uniref:Uncharacterized protein n=1 Tax=uncultured Caudovirales phage TaxID=2100421 RepID=A0A6J5NH75_9CAUD|nr:hypothetical protein UFOVP650_31 [uncultured Caudovirales phage]
MTFDDDVLAFAQALTALMPNTRHWTDNPAAVVVAVRLTLRLQDRAMAPMQVAEAWVAAFELDKRVRALEASIGRGAWHSIGELDLRPAERMVCEFKADTLPDITYGFYDPSNGWEFVTAAGQSFRKHMLGKTTLGFMSQLKFSQFRRLDQ